MKAPAISLNEHNNLISYLQSGGNFSDAGDVLRFDRWEPNVVGSFGKIPRVRVRLAVHVTYDILSQHNLVFLINHHTKQALCCYLYSHDNSYIFINNLKEARI